MSNISGTSQYSNSAPPTVPAGSNTLKLEDFLERVKYTREQVVGELQKSIQEIKALHARALSSADPSSSAQLEGRVSQTQLLTTQIRDSIRYLEVDAAKTEDSRIKLKQVKQLKTQFEEELKAYQNEEVEYRKQYREQIRRQYLIVNPDASNEEAEQASEMDWSNEGVFQTAVSFRSLCDIWGTLGLIAG